MTVSLGTPPELATRLISCGIGSYPIVVIAGYKGKLVPIQGASVTLKLGAAFPGWPMTVIPLWTDSDGVAQTCVGWANYVEAWIQKGDVDFGSGVFQIYKIGSIPGGPGREIGVTFIIEAKTPPPCFGSIDLPNVYEVIGAFSAPSIGISPAGIALPSVPRLTVNAVINNVSQSIPIAVIVDGKQVATPQSSGGIDVLSIIRSFGPDALKTGHTISIEPRLPDCNIPAPPPFNIPALSLPTLCTLPAILNPVTGKCETPCTSPAVYNPLSGRCETPTLECKPPQVPNYVTGRCETPCPTGTVLNPITGVCTTPPEPPGPPSPAGKSVRIQTIDQAYPTQDVPIVITVLCGAKPSNGEWAQLFVDGQKIDERRTANGLVQFTWEAVAGSHRIMVDVPQSDFCDRPGRDTKDIEVTSQVPAIFEQLAREREAFLKQRQALDEQRRKIRELQLPYTVALPTAPTTSILKIPVFKAPAGTTVLIGGQVIPAPTTGPIEVTLPPGEYTVIIQPPGGLPVEIPITLPPSITPIPITIPTIPMGG